MNAAMTQPVVPHEVLSAVTPDGRRLRITVRGTSPLRGMLILLPAGLKYSVGPHRLNHKLSRELADLGLGAAYVDPGGYGDSDGRPPRGSTPDVWRSIESGALVDDILVAARELRSRYPRLPFYLCGLCGGAVTAFIAAARAPGLFQGVVSFSLAVQVTPTGTTRTPLGSPTFARNLLGAYAQRALSLDAWRRIFSGEAGLTGPLRAAAATLRHSLRPISEETTPGLNMHLRDALRTLATRSVPQLMIFGGSDRRHHEFVDASARGIWQDNAIPDICRIETVPQANHEFHFPEWQASAFRVTREWIASQLDKIAGGNP